MPRINQEERAFLAWKVLTANAKSGTRITYGELGRAIGIHYRAVRYVLGLIQDYCLEQHIPPLTILVVNRSGRPGSGFIAYDLKNFDQGLQWVQSYDWDSRENPF